MDMNPLPGFHFVGERDAYQHLHQCLWRDSSVQPTDEPEALARHIKVLNNVNSGGNSIRFINLDESPELCIDTLVWPHSSTLLVRDEYREFMQDILKLDPFKRRFYVTGQPGIGKSVGASYFLFWLLASGQPVLLFPDASEVLYFSLNGVQAASQRDLNTRNLDLRAAVENSWVLIDVDVGASAGAEGWYPGLWINPAAAVIWTSSESGPLYDRRRRFTERYRATTWYMAPWSHDEIAAMIELEHKNPEDIWARYERSGPVARALFDTQDPDTDSEIDRVIRTALANGLYDFGTSQAALARIYSHQIFLIRPSAELPGDGVSPIPTFNRSRPTYHFLSDHIVSRVRSLAKSLPDLLDSASPYDDPRTRAAAGQLVEYTVRKRPDGLEPEMGHPDVLTLICTPRGFSIDVESHNDSDPGSTLLPPRPLYLRPRDPNFAFAATGVDAILLTDDTIRFIHTSFGIWHPSLSETMQAILNCLEQYGIAVGELRKVYCVVGEDHTGVSDVVEKVRTTKKKLAKKKLVLAGGQDLLEELEVQGYDSSSGYRSWEMDVIEWPDEDDGEEEQGESG
ncbi:hypothetical protein C8R45DRAFT_1009283 [Mycena sanguinolenta]|nr:hypothetical protein C8R45DRAFT_1009283 [Mycena sanguinolenta]